MRRPRSHRRHQRGAAMVEAAIISPIFFALIFGVVELGLLFRNSLTTDNATLQGARSAAATGQEPASDYLIIRSIEHGLAAMDLQDLDYVVVFRASSPSDTVPAACLIASQTFDPANPSAPACNRYTAADFFLEIEDPVTGADTGNWKCGVAAVDRFWCPTDRETRASAGTDYVGVHIQTRHDYITGFFGGGQDLTETTIVRLEPDRN